MMTCLPCSKPINGRSLHEQEEDDVNEPEYAKQGVKALTAQIKDMAMKASGAYKSCKPCSGSSGHKRNQSYAESDGTSASERCHYSYRKTGSSSSTPRIWGKEMEARLKGLSSGEGTPASMSGRAESVMFMEEDEPKEWVAHVEPGVLITFVSLLTQGGNDLKRIRFSRDLFNKWQAQRWWADNYDKVMELYNVQGLSHEGVPVQAPARSEDEISKIESIEESPMTPPLSKERIPRNLHRPKEMVHSSSDAHDNHALQSHNYLESGGIASTPKLSSMSGTKTKISSVDAASARSSSSQDCSGELSMSNASDVETEWVEQDEPGVYITIRSLPGGLRELRRVRFSREKFGEMHARLWWEANRARVQEQYL